ncbi:MAG: hypothetical protein RLZZ174_754 [Pseudomonadota bacterium]|jgi:stearoyl-CoA desaturase (delta-9 desaturase)
MGIDGLLHFSIWEMVLATLVLTHITIVSVTVYLHRYSAHRALELSPVLQHFFRFWLWLTTGMGTREWTAIHRKHHAMCETPEDPHSPQILGLKKVLLEGAELYKYGKTPETVERYGRGCPDDWIERNVYRHNTYGIVLMLFADLLLFGVYGITIWAVQMLWIPVLAAGVINGVGHYYGYRNYECGDAARNIVPWGILIGGEELHNNHHTYPNSAKLSQKWYEFDIGWFWIRLFQLFGMAKPRSTGPHTLRDPAKAVLDFDAARALVHDRFRVMERFAKQVVRPTIAQEANAAEKSLRTLMVRESSLVSTEEQARLEGLLAQYPTLKTVYEMRLSLQQVWARRGESKEAMLDALRDWVARAEASGIAALREFADEFKSYALPRAAA